MIFVDLEETYNRVPREVLWKVPEKRRVCIVIVQAIRGMCDGWQVVLEYLMGPQKIPYSYRIGPRVNNKSSSFLPWSWMHSLNISNSWCHNACFLVEDIILVGESRERINGKLKLSR